MFQHLSKDLRAGVVVFLVALPLCLGIALASKAPLFSGIVAGIIGGTITALISGSSTSVTGPAAGLTAVVATSIATLNGSFEAFLLAVVFAGVMQLALGALKAGFISEYFPSTVIKGLLAAIGVILILKQIPHAFGHDKDGEGEFSFEQLDGQTTFSELLDIFNVASPSAILVTIVGIAILVLWDKTPLKKSFLPAALAVVIVGALMNMLFIQLGGDWVIDDKHLVNLPVLSGIGEFSSLLVFPDFSQITNPAVYKVAFTIGAVASLETLLNIEAVDKLDPEKRETPANRELLAQGAGNIVSGLLGGLPVTSVIIRGSVNISAGGKTKLSVIIHAVLLALSVLLFPTIMNHIPLSALAAILLVTGWKLAGFPVFVDMYKRGWSQFIPFFVTVVAIYRTDLLIGVLIGLAVSIVFILRANQANPYKMDIKSTGDGTDTYHIQLSQQTTFLQRAPISLALSQIPENSHLIIDANQTHYIDADIAELINEFKNQKANVRNIKVQVIGSLVNNAVQEPEVLLNVLDASEARS